MVWEPPPVGKRNGDIIYYKIFYVPSTVPSTREEQESTMVKIEDVSNTSEFVIDELKKWTEYRVWMLAGTIVGDGPSSYPVLVRTGEDGMPLIFNTKNFDHTIKRFLFFFTLNKIHGTVFQGEVLCNYVLEDFFGIHYSDNSIKRTILMPFGQY